MENEEKFDDVIEVILAGAKSQPRSVLQIFRSFLNRWRIVQIRRKNDENYNITDPKLLALILVLQNDYPELFLRILHYPTHLLYLYSLIKQKPLGNIFSIIDIDEINNLGVAIDNNTKEYAYDVIYKQELRQLFDAIGESIKIDGDFNINVWAKTVNEYTTLLGGQSILSTHNDFLETLFSGDIVRIQIDLEGSKDIFEQHALGKLTILLDTLKEIENKKNDSISRDSVIKQIEKLIIPWGYFEELESLYKLEDLILKNRELPINLRMRCLYIFFKQAYRREGSDKKAISIILSILEEELNKKFSPMLSKVAYLLRYIKLTDSDNFEEFSKVFNKFSFWDKVTQDIFIESLLKAYTGQHNQEFGYWGYDLIDKINPKNVEIDVFDFIRILRKINQENQSWLVKKYSSYFRDQIKTSQEIAPNIAYEIIKGFFNLLKEHVEDNETERQMVSELVAIIPPMKYYENKLEDEDFNKKVSGLQWDILGNALDIQYKIQGNSVIDEWSDAWININPEIKIEELGALRSLQVLSPKAVNFVGYLYEKSEYWKADFAYLLRDIRGGKILDNAIMQEEMKNEAEKICQRLGL